MRKAERPWIFGAALGVLVLVIVIGFAVSYSPAEPTEPQTTVPVFDGSTGVPGTGEGNAAPIGGGSAEPVTSTEAPALSSPAPATSSEAPATSSEAPATSSEAPAGSTAATAGSSSAEAGDDSAGKTVFAANCASCHGADGTGGVGPDLTSLAAAADPAVVAKQVKNGGTIMPAFAGRLSDQEIQDVAAYVSKELAPH